MIDSHDTICAISTPIGEGGISIVRLSGDAAVRIVDDVFQAASKKKLCEASSHTVHYGHIVYEGEVIDEVLVTVFRSPRSYTCEDIVEINTHGGIVITKRILDLFIVCGARLADAGEFTKRAFLNGRIDLTQAEAVLDVIKAKTDLSARTAGEHLSGRLSGDIKKMKDSLVSFCAHIEAFIDFPEEDIEVYQNDDFCERMSEIESALGAMIKTYQHGEIIREGVHTVIVGAPNVGKSSLLNTLLNRDRAIVSDVAGTTRDALEELIEIDGVLFRVVDTAGIMPSPQHALDYLSVEKTREHYHKGDLILFMLDGARPLSEDDHQIYQEIKDKRYIIVINKSDMPSKIDKKIVHEWTQEESMVTISAVSLSGIRELEKALVGRVWQGAYSERDTVIMRVRHKHALEKACGNIEKAQECFRDKKGLELLAYEVRGAIGALEELIGEVYSDEILNAIFSEFCIGK